MPKVLDSAGDRRPRAVIKREGSVIFDRDRPRLVDNSFIFKKMI